MRTRRYEELQEFYSRKSREELLRLAADASSLTEDAKCAITVELQKRGLVEDDVRPYRYRLEQERQPNAERREATAQKFKLPKRLQWVWPDIVDEASAKKAAKYGFESCMCIAALNLIVGILCLLGVKIGNFDAWIIVDAGLFAIIGWRIYKLSRTGAVLGLILFVLEIYYKAASGERGAIGVITIILLLGFFSGVRGTFAFHRFGQAQKSGTPTSKFA
jgi:hypothetical protein